MVTFAVANQKGGVGKTTAAANLGYLLSQDHQLRVALIDLDPQGNLSMAFEYERADRSLAEWLMNPSSAPDGFLSRVSPTLGLFPSDQSLAGAEVALARTQRSTLTLSLCLERLQGQFDAVLIDCPPSLGILTVNALTAADAVIVPLQCSYWSLQGLRQLLDVIDRVKTHGNPNLRVLGILLNQADPRTLHAREVIAGIRSRFGDLVFGPVIPRTVRFDDVTSAHQPLVAFAPTAPAAQAYAIVAQEIMQRSGLLARGGDVE